MRTQETQAEGGGVHVVRPRCWDSGAGIQVFGLSSGVGVQFRGRGANHEVRSTCGKQGKRLAQNLDPHSHPGPEGPHRPVSTERQEATGAHQRCLMAGTCLTGSGTPPPFSGRARHRPGKLRRAGHLTRRQQEGGDPLRTAGPGWAGRADPP